MNLKVFIKEIARRLYPILRDEGFRGSGTTLQRIQEPLVHVFNVQGSSSGDGCYLNLGVHLTFLPTEGGRVPDVKYLKEYECAFRGRIDPPAGCGFGWNYGANDAEMNEWIECICDHWNVYGRSFFQKLSAFPDDFASLVEATDESTVHPVELLTFARIAAHLGKTQRAQVLAQEALNRCPERATGLRDNLKEFVHTI